MKKVSLWGLSGAAVIVPESTNLVYSNQVGGTACFQKELEGFLIPLNNDCLPQNYKDLIETQLCSLFVEDGKPFDSNMADQLDKLLWNYPETTSIKVDQTKISESMQAWVYVVLEENAFSLFSGLGKTKGVLTWCNSD